MVTPVKVTAWEGAAFCWLECAPTGRCLSVDGGVRGELHDHSLSCNYKVRPHVRNLGLFPLPLGTLERSISILGPADPPKRKISVPCF